MGALPSTLDLDNVDVEDDVMQSYTCWTMAEVEVAYERLLAKAGGSGGDVFQVLSIGRMDFVEVFTDYTIIRGGTWLALPLPEFDRFDPGKNERVYTFEVFAVLALLCVSDSDGARIAFIFRLFDFGKQRRGRVEKW